MSSNSVALQSCLCFRPIRGHCCYFLSLVLGGSVPPPLFVMSTVCLPVWSVFWGGMTVSLPVEEGSCVEPAFFSTCGSGGVLSVLPPSRTLATAGDVKWQLLAVCSWCAWFGSHVCLWVITTLFPCPESVKLLPFFLKAFSSLSRFSLFCFFKIGGKRKRKWKKKERKTLFCWALCRPLPMASHALAFGTTNNSVAW